MIRPKLRGPGWKELVKVARKIGPQKAFDTLHSIFVTGKFTKTAQIEGRITTIEELKEFTRLDEQNFYVRGGRVNSWETHIKDKDGNIQPYTNIQVRADFQLKNYAPPDKEFLDVWLTEVSEKYKTVGNVSQISDKNVTGKPVVVVLGDLHIGGLTENSLLVNDHNIEDIRSKLLGLATRINLQYPNRPVHIMFAGDLIESFTGKNHANTWKTISMHGAKVVLKAFDLMYEFCGLVQNFSHLYMIPGNHDRISSSNDDDQVGEVIELVHGMFERVGGFDSSYHPLLLSQEIDGVNYILTHGNKKISKKEGSRLAFDYGNPELYNVVLSAHLHHRQTVEDSWKYRVEVIPSVCNPNEYAMSLGEHSRPGCYIFEECKESVDKRDLPL